MAGASPPPHCTTRVGQVLLRPLIVYTNGPTRIDNGTGIRIEASSHADYRPGGTDHFSAGS
jgi:hypothetical protein